MAGADSLVAQLKAQRLSWCPLQADQPEGPAVQMDTPSQFAASGLAQALRSGDGDGAIRILCGLARGWRGVSQALLLGAGVGSDDAAPFSAQLLQPLLEDRPQWVSDLAIQVMEGARLARERAQGGSGN